MSGMKFVNVFTVNILNIEVGIMKKQYFNEEDYMYISDRTIKNNIQELFKSDNRLNLSDIRVHVKDNVVTLGGYAFNRLAKTAARMDALKISEVQKVRDEIKIGYPSKSSKSVDENIQTDIKDLLGTISHQNSEYLDVTVSDGIVIIEGSVNSFLKKNQIEEVILENASAFDIVNKINIKNTK
jgi:osmotically-inducible protein OsmY